MKKIVAIMCLLMLTGCFGTIPQAHVEVPASLIQKCPPLVKLEGMDGKALLNNITANAKIYYTCSDMHDKLIEAVKPNK